MSLAVFAIAYGRLELQACPSTLPSLLSCSHILLAYSSVLSILSTFLLLDHISHSINAAHNPNTPAANGPTTLTAFKLLYLFNNLITFNCSYSV